VHEARAHDRRERNRDDAREDDRRSERNRELEEQRAGQAALESDRRVDGGQGDRHRDNRAEQFARADQRRLDPRFALAHVPLHVLDDDNRVVDNQADRQHEREDRQEIQAETEREHDDRRPDQRDRHGDQRHQGGPHGTHEQKDHDCDDQDRFTERLSDLLQRALHEHRPVPDQAHVDIFRQRRPEALHLVAQPMRDLDLVRADQRPDPQVDALLLAVLRDHVGFLGAEFDPRHVAQTHDGAGAVGDDQILELIGRA
jgi:hypothetical protein